LNTKGNSTQTMSGSQINYRKNCFQHPSLTKINCDPAYTSLAKTIQSKRQVCTIHRQWRQPRTPWISQQRPHIQTPPPESLSTDQSFRCYPIYPAERPLRLLEPDNSKPSTWRPPRRVTSSNAQSSSRSTPLLTKTSSPI
jgi:hypothetical protein